MGKFLNDLKRAFTAPKTRHMKKKINSMKDYMGFTKKLFEQMEQDAIFFKTCEEKFDRAVYGLTEPASPKWTYKQLTQHATNGNYFNDLHAHKINWYKIGDKELSEFETNTNNEIINQKATYENSQKTYNLQTLMDDINPDKIKSYNTYSIPTTSLQEYIKISENYRDFCRKIKQEIKKLFEKKQKEFETQRKNEKASLQLLQKHQQNLETYLNNNNFREALETWGTIQQTYAQLNTQENADNNKLINITYKLAKQTITNDIRTKIQSYCNKINKALTSYVQDTDYKNTTKLNRKDADELTKHTKDLTDLLYNCLNCDDQALLNIGITKNDITQIARNMTAITSPFLAQENTIPIKDLQYSNGLDTIKRILKNWQ